MRILSFKLSALSILIIITLFGAYLRFVNISPLKIYPDSYQTLTVAQNISESGSVVSTLGENGYVYPPFFGWTRPGLPLLVNFFNLFISNQSSAAQTVVLIASILIIPATFLLLFEITGSKKTGLFAALLSAISFNIVVWSGFIYTESLGVLLMTFFLATFFQTQKKVTKIADFRELLAGFILAAAVLTRYEYVLILIPVMIYLLFFSQNWITRLLNLSLSFGLLFGLVFINFFPILDSFRILFFDNSTFIKFGGLGLILVIGLIVLKRYLLKLKGKYLAKIFVISTLVIFCYLVIQIFFPGTFKFLRYNLSAWRDFVLYDFLLSLFILLGISSLLIKKNKFKPFLIFAIISVITLIPAYYKTNPTMSRYLTHLLPFFIMIASLGAMVIYRKYRNKFFHIQELVLLTFLFLLFAVQILITFQGVKPWEHGEWFKKDYSEISSTLFKEKLQPPASNLHPLLITSLPEAYYYFTKIPTQSIADSYPYIFLDDSINNKNIVIVEDMAMRDLFPNFSKELDAKFLSFKTQEYWVGASYHWGNKTFPETKPVEIYILNLGQFKEIIGKK
jgi:4-amino-4-deoxy-L-arabinose transferase-like glycosyltransferase